jgi:uncharacterized membrane protein YuzA (DUF378 family)
VLLHAANPVDVVRRVETEPTGGAGRLEQAVPPLPRSQELGRDAGAPTELTDAEKGGFHEADYTTPGQLLDKALIHVYLPAGQFLYRRCTAMRKLDLLAATLLIVGGLNWGLVAIAKFDLVAWIFGLDFGQTNAASRIVYGLVGLAAVYGIVSLVSRVRGTSPEPIAAR